MDGGARRRSRVVARVTRTMDFTTEARRHGERVPEPVAVIPLNESDRFTCGHTAVRCPALLSASVVKIGFLDARALEGADLLVHRQQIEIVPSLDQLAVVPPAPGHAADVNRALGRSCGSGD